MSVNKIFLMSPREPSGATWLINCFLELGIKTYRKSSSDMWVQHGDYDVLGKHEEILKKWLPALWDHQQFKFRDDIEVEWSHVWPTDEHDNHQIVYFARDPRDSLFSRYKREAPDQTFEEFLEFPDINTLLDKMHNWRLFNLAWMQHPCHKVFRFEDYKQDAPQVLSDVLGYLGLSYSEPDMQRAVACSTFERAAQAEIKYRAKYPEDKQLINRSGKAGEWRQGGIDSGIVARIESVCADAMRIQGYACNETRIQDANYSGLVSVLPFLQQTKLPVFAYGNSNGADLSAKALEFADLLQREILERACLQRYEIGKLLDNLTTLSRAGGRQNKTSFKPLYRAFGILGQEFGMWEKFWYRLNALPGRIRNLIVRLTSLGRQFNE